MWRLAAFWKSEVSGIQYVFCRSYPHTNVFLIYLWGKKVIHTSYSSAILKVSRWQIYSLNFVLWLCAYGTDKEFIFYSCGSLGQYLRDLSFRYFILRGLWSLLMQGCSLESFKMTASCLPVSCIFGYLSTVCSKDYYLHWKSTDHRCMGLFLDSQFYFIGIYISMFMAVSYCFHYCHSVESIEIKKCEISLTCPFVRKVLFIKVPCNSVWILGGVFISAKRQLDVVCIWRVLPY